MTIEELLTMWVEDSKIDGSQLDTESINVPRLHSKYLKLLSGARLKLRRLKLRQKTLTRDLVDYYRGDLNNPEDLARLNKEPWPKSVMKADIPSYVDSDEQMLQLLTAMIAQEEIVDVCTEIIKSINSRGYQIGTAVNYKKLTEFGS